MKHETYRDDERKFFYCTLEGELDIEESILLSKNLRSKASELGFNVFYDARELCEPNSIMPVYDFSTKLASILDIPAHRIVKVSFLKKSGFHDDLWNFYENVAVNRGLTIKIFTEEEEAIKWLSN